ncbi:FkbM family methyltransferase [Pantoea sp.]|uniref:FkbM family methyltransferase n=1 Tax=Pantoea sp. TaxID=69393 RepID=UPI00289A362B|nr:FkbM family methyltransferase [Pantoea sp.]
MHCNEDEVVRFCEEFSVTTRPRYAFGVTPYSRDIASHFPLSGFIDEYINEAFIDGVPVVNRSQLPVDAMIVCGIADGKALTAQCKLEEIGLEFIDFFSFYRFFANVLTPAEFYHGADFIDDYVQNRDAYNQTRTRLADKCSVDTFDKIVDFRLTNYISALNGFTCQLSEQYFDLPFIKDYTEHFVDCGAFDGATSQEFIRRFPHYQSIHCFEPDSAQCKRMATLFQDHPRIAVHPYGVSDKRATLYFTLSGSMSKICEQGEIAVEVISLDDYLSGPVSFIKMDIEGHELQALAGAEKTIKKYKPLLAICCYHRPDDFRTIPDLVLSFYSGYKLYMRHYTEGLLETVYYFVPEGSADE